MVLNFSVRISVSDGVISLEGFEKKLEVLPHESNLYSGNPKETFHLSSEN